LEGEFIKGESVTAGGYKALPDSEFMVSLNERSIESTHKLNASGVNNYVDVESVNRVIANIE
jgi:hypothetical protein